MTGPKTAMTPLERRAADAIRPGRLRYAVDDPDGHFAADMQGLRLLTDKQRVRLWRIVRARAGDIGDPGLAEAARLSLINLGVRRPL